MDHSGGFCLAFPFGRMDVQRAQLCILPIALLGETRTKLAPGSALSVRSKLWLCSDDQRRELHSSPCSVSLSGTHTKKRRQSAFCQASINFAGVSYRLLSYLHWANTDPSPRALKMLHINNRLAIKLYMVGILIFGNPDHQQPESRLGSHCFHMF